MSRKLFVVLFSVLFLFSCDYKGLSVLSSKKMSEVLIDMHILEHVFRNSPVRNKTTTEKQEYINFVFEKHGITKDDFDASVKWYATHPDEYILIYDVVIDSLGKLQFQVENYAYHIENKPTYLDSIDTVDIWKWEKSIAYNITKEKNRNKEFEKNRDKLNFIYSDTTYFAKGDIYKLRFRMRLYDEDTNSIYNTMFFVNSSDSVIDTVMTCVLPDSVERIYTMTISIPDSIKITHLEGKILDKLDNKKAKLNVDSIELFKIYQYYKYPFSINLSSHQQNVDNRYIIGNRINRKIITK